MGTQGQGMASKVELKIVGQGKYILIQQVGSGELFRAESDGS